MIQLVNGFRSNGRFVEIYIGTTETACPRVMVVAKVTTTTSAWMCWGLVFWHCKYLEPESISGFRTWYPKSYLGLWMIDSKPKKGWKFSPELKLTQPYLCKILTYFSQYTGGSTNLNHTCFPNKFDFTDFIWTTTTHFEQIFTDIVVNYRHFF